MKTFYAQALCDYTGGLTACDNKACQPAAANRAASWKTVFPLPDWLFVHRIAVELLPMRQVLAVAKTSGASTLSWPRTHSASSCA